MQTRIQSGQRIVRYAATALLLSAVISAGAQTSGIVTVTPPPGAPVVTGGFVPSGATPDLGWPVNLGLNNSGYPYTPTLFDVDNDGADEILVVGGNIFGIRGNGTFLTGWPTAEQQYMGYGTNACKPGPSAADVDGDGIGEVLWSLRDWWAGSARMWCFNGKRLDYSNMPGFPQYAPNDYSNALDSPFVLGDTNGDGKLEAWSAHTLGNTGVYYRISGFETTNGTRLFTTDLHPQETVLNLFFGDLDGDGRSEMFAISWLAPFVQLRAFHADGSVKPGYPVVLATLGSGFFMPFEPPLAADLDGNGDLELIVGWWSNASYAGILHHDGSPYPGYPITIATGSQLFGLGLGDLTGDGQPELLAIENTLGYPPPYRAFAFDLPTGTILGGWPVDLNGWPKGTPIVVDVDNDGKQEMCFSTDLGEVYAIKHSGVLAPGFPKMMSAPSISGVAAGDLDGDGLYELVAATWNGFVYAWDTDGVVKAGRADWPMRGANARNTSVFGDYDVATGDLNCDGVVDFDDINPFVLALSDPGGYATAYPNCRIRNGDTNHDGRVTFDDINPFVALLTQ
ncbi:MAG: VCBS repeat-containing protein [Planctomycetota bacterium]